MPVDLLSDVLAEFPVAGSLTCRLERGAPWAIGYPGGGAGFHLVVAGGCTLEVTRDDGTVERRRLGAGDLVVLPHGHAHVLRDGGPARVEPIAEAARTAAGRNALAAVPPVVTPEPGGGDAGEGRTIYVCGTLRFAEGAAHPLLAALPPVLHVPGVVAPGGGIGAAPAPGVDPVIGPWLGTFVAAMTCEAAGGRPGAEVVLARLADVLFVHAVRAHLAAGNEAGRGWLAALRHPGIARALAAMHAAPARAWTVATLAHEAAMSRSRFAERFTALIGRPPLDYLAEWRMTRARRLLREGREPVATIAARLGYRSEAAFSHAFRRRQGVAPGAWRRAARDDGAAADGVSGRAA